jgi:hypothetical protein
MRSSLSLSLSISHLNNCISFFADDRLRKVENRLRHAKRPQKKSSLPSTYKVDPEGAPFTRRQLRVKAKIMPELIAVCASPQINPHLNLHLFLDCRMIIAKAGSGQST